MQKLAFAFEKGGEKRLEILWEGAWKEVTVSLDGNSIGVIPDQKALFAGQEFHLMDGSTIKVQLVKKFVLSYLRVFRNGYLLSGSASEDPQTRLKNAYGMVYFVAGLNLALGFVSFLFNIEFLRQIGLGFGSIIVGLVFLVLGFFIQRKSTVALNLAIGIFALDGILGFLLIASHSVGGIVTRIFLLIPMVQGVDAIKALKQKSE